MSLQLVPPTIDPEEALERATQQLDAVIAIITDLIGPSAMAARVAGRIARAAQLQLKRPHP